MLKWARFSAKTWDMHVINCFFIACLKTSMKNFTTEPFYNILKHVVNEPLKTITVSIKY